MSTAQRVTRVEARVDAQAVAQVCVTVSAGARRADLVLPAAVPVAELVPELARSLGLLDAATVHSGLRLTTAGGRRLTGERGLGVQGVTDGGLLVLAADVEPVPRRRYDDVAEAVADAVARGLRPWEPATGRRTGLVGAALLLSLGAVALAFGAGGSRAGVAAAVMAAALVGGGVVAARARGEAGAAVAVAWLGVAYAALAGWLLASGAGPVWRGGGSGASVAAAGVGLVGAGAVALVGLRRGRMLLLPAVVVGVVLVAGGVAAEVVVFRPAPVVSAAQVVVVVVGSFLPTVALATTSTRAAVATRAPGGVDAERVAADARAAHDLLLGLSTTAGLLVVLASPFAVSLGAAGTALAATCCLVVLLQARRHHGGAEVLAGLLCGLAGLVVVAASVLMLHPDWRDVAAGVLAAAGLSVLVGVLVPGARSVRRARLLDLAESTALLALLPLLAVAIGLLDAVGGAVAGLASGTVG